MPNPDGEGAYPVTSPVYFSSRTCIFTVSSVLTFATANVMKFLGEKGNRKNVNSKEVSNNLENDTTIDKKCL